MLNIAEVLKEYGINLSEANKTSDKLEPAVDVVPTPLSWKPAIGGDNISSLKAALENL